MSPFASELLAKAPARRVVLRVLLCVPFAGAAQARTALAVTDARMRQPRPGFGATVVFMDLLPAADGELVGAATPVARAVELQRTVREGSVVQMVAVPAIPLQGGQPLRLRTGEGAYHLMVSGLRLPLQVGSRVPLDLALRDARGRVTRHRVQVRVAAAGHGHAEGEDDMH